MKQHNLIAIDLAKNCFQVCILEENQKVTLNRKVSRSKLPILIAQQAPTTVAMEACYSSHYWARLFEEMGHSVQLLPAQHVKPFVRGNKNDCNDALAIAEAALRPKIRRVPVKSEAQQDIQALHRIRDRIVRQRTGLVNQTRGILSEYGVIAPVGHKAFCQLIAEATQGEATTLSPLLQGQLRLIAEEFYALTDRLDEMNCLLKGVARQHPTCQLLMTLPGVGYLVATSLVSAIGNGSQFESGRELAVWLGLTPRQIASGNKSYMAGITKRGNPYLRKQLVHGARAALHLTKNPDDKVIRWARVLATRRGPNKAAVALAARIARLAWVLMQRQTAYNPTH